MADGVVVEEVFERGAVVTGVDLWGLGRGNSEEGMEGEEVRR